MCFVPSLWCDFGDLAVGHVGQAGEDFTKISEGIKPATAAAFNDGVDDRADLTGIGVADEEPVLLADGRGADGVFDQVVVNLHPAIIQINAQRAPLVQRI